MINNDKNFVYNKYQISKDFENVDRLAYLLDERFEILGFRFGWDPLINLIPGLGNLIGLLTSGGLVVIMSRNGVSGKVLIIMLGNVLLDMVVGALPIIGNIGDFFFKANTRNVALLKAHYFEDKHKGSGKGILIGILLVFFAVLIGIAYLLFQAIMWSYEKIGTIF